MTILHNDHTEILALIQRVAPPVAPLALIESIPDAAGRDTWQLDCAPGRITLRGNTGVAVASALCHYLRHVAGIEPLSSRPCPDSSPTPANQASGASPHRWRYYLNYVTYSYTMPWWDWERWEREIDWMALHGINMPLAMSGQDAIWQQVYRAMGVTDAELEQFFVGPAYSAFNWMGLVDGWGGPLPQSWIDDQLALQHRILERQRALGMTPVLPAFNGHVPAAFERLYPDRQFAHPKWGTFPGVTMLSPDDELFVEIGKRFIEELTAEFATDHIYSADAFIETLSPSNDPEYLRQVSAAIYRSMAAADPEAVWVMQGWMFHYMADFWQPPQIEAFLSGVADDKMLILDLWSEMNPVWQQTQGYHGKPWLWCMVHNFGGNHSIFGTMPRLAAGPTDARRDPLGANIQGIGLTMEDTEQNPVVYDLMTDNAWASDAIDLDEWLPAWVARRYGTAHPDALAAWNVLRHSAFSCGQMKTGGPRSMITARPNLTPGAFNSDVASVYDPDEIARAAMRLAAAVEELYDVDEYRYDLVDVTRQVIANAANNIHRSIVETRAAGDREAERGARRRFLSAIDDLDSLVATRPEFLLGRWLSAARDCGHTPAESDLYEHNARNLITLWHDADHSLLQDYSCRQWSGLLTSFYKQRWLKFFDYLDVCDHAATAPDECAFAAQLRQWEWQWIENKSTFPTEPTGNPATQAQKLIEHYINAP